MGRFVALEGSVLIRYFAVLAVWLVAGHAAVAGGTRAPPPCPNEIVDVYLSPWKRGPGLEPNYLRPGPPLVHLRLPRQGLRVDLEPSVWAPLADCGQKEFTGWQASYGRTSDLARGLGISYDHPRLHDYRFEFYALDPDERPPSPQALPPVNDTDDRESMARKGSWIIDSSNQGVSGKFCLDPPAPKKQCYVYVGQGLSYRTGNVNIFALAFSSATFGPPPDRLWKQITITDLDGYFSFLRRVADLVVVSSSKH